MITKRHSDGLKSGSVQRYAKRARTAVRVIWRDWEALWHKPQTRQQAEEFKATLHDFSQVLILVAFLLMLALLFHHFTVSLGNPPQ